MTTPDKPLRFEFSVEVAGTPDQVWHAIASADGISSWFLPTDLEPREGGALVTHMGDTSSSGSVTGWDPPRRLEYEEPDWADLSGHPEGEVTPLTTEFLVEARSGGTCVVRVTSSAFGIGADWESESLDMMERSWRPFFDLLRLYLARFPGQRAVQREVRVDLEAGVDVDAAVASAARTLGVSAPGDVVAVDGGLGLDGTVVHVGPPYLMVEAHGPVPGYLAVDGIGREGDGATAQLSVWLFGPDAAAFADESEAGWRAWLAGLGR